MEEEMSEEDEKEANEIMKTLLELEKEKRKINSKITTITKKIKEIKERLSKIGLVPLPF